MQWHVDVWILNLQYWYTQWNIMYCDTLMYHSIVPSLVWTVVILLCAWYIIPSSVTYRGTYDLPSGVSDNSNHSYVMKYTPLAGTSVHMIVHHYVISTTPLSNHTSQQCCHGSTIDISYTSLPIQLTSTIPWTGISCFLFTTLLDLWTYHILHITYLIPHTLCYAHNITVTFRLWYVVWYFSL